MTDSTPGGLAALAYRLPPRRLDIETLHEQGAVASQVPFLLDLGFGYSHLDEHPEAFEEQVIGCAEELLTRTGFPRKDVRWLIRYTGLEPVRVNGSTNGAPDVLQQFRYPVSEAQHRLDLPNASGLAVSQQGCSGLLSSIHLATRLLASSDEGAVLCLAGDALPAGANREVLYNVMSDAAGAVLVTPRAEKNRVLHFYQRTMPYYWNTPEHLPELLASYFPLAQRVIQKTLDEAGVSADDVAWFVPHNVSRRSWRILGGLLGVPESKIWCDNIARVGHTVSCDHVINLADMEAQGLLRPGDLLLLFTFGFGASWTCMLVSH